MKSPLLSRREFTQLSGAGILLGGMLLPRAAQAADKATITIGGIAEDANLDPNSITATDWIGLLCNMYETTVVRTPQGQIAGGLAESWRQISPTKLEFTTRADVFFHNGDKFGPEDIAYTYNRVIDRSVPLPQASYLSSIEKVSVTGSNTLEIDLKFDDPLFVEYLLLVPIVQRNADKSFLARRANGTGPYKLENWAPGDQLSIVANPKYWGNKPSVQRAIFRSIPEANSLVAAMQSGEIDIAVGLQPDVAETLKGAADLDIVSINTDRNLFIILDNTVKPLDDPKFRRALNLAVDRDALVKDILLGYGTPTANMLGPMYLGYDPDLKPVYDPDQAKKLLAEAGYANGVSVTLNATSGRYMKDQEIGEALVGQWARVGINVKLNLMEFGTLMTGFRTHKLSPAYLIGVSLPIWDSARVGLQSYFTREYPQAYFRDDQLEAEIHKAVQISDRARREEEVRKINAELYDKDALVHLYQQKAIFGLSKRVSWTPRSDEQIRIYEVGLKQD